MEGPETVKDSFNRGQSGYTAVQPLLDEFNKHRVLCISPGLFLCVDESMAPWRGKDGMQHTR